MKRLPDSELEIMMIIWELKVPVTRAQIEEQLNKEIQWTPTTILSFLTRLQEKGFLEVTKEGKTNIYTARIAKEEYLKKESKNILKRMYQNSLKNFLTALTDGEDLTQEDMEELQMFLDKKRNDKS